MKEKATNILIGILLIAVVANGAVSVGLYNQVQGYQVASQTEVFESQIDDLVLQLNELQSGLTFLNESIMEEIQTIRANLTELQQTLADLDPVDIVTQLAEIQARIDQIIAEIIQTIAEIPASMNYTVTNPITNNVVYNVQVVDGGYPLVVFGPSRMPWTVVVKEYPYYFQPFRVFAGLDTIPIEEHGNWTGRAVTWVIVIYHDGLNVTEGLSSISIDTEMSNVTYTPFNSTIVGNSIEFSYSPHDLIGYASMLMTGDLPEGEYTIVQYWRDT